MLGVAHLLDFTYLTIIYRDGADVESRFIGRISDVEFSIHDLGALLCTARSVVVPRLSFGRLDKYSCYLACLRFGLHRAGWPWRFPCNNETGTNIIVLGSEMMTRRLPDGSEERFGSGDIREIYIVEFANRNITL